MEKLVTAFNSAAGVMRRNTISMNWDDDFYDCDFSQMLDLPVASPVQPIRDFDAALGQRAIVLNRHCYGCTTA